MTARPQLALAGRDNPRCTKCGALVSATAQELPSQGEAAPHAMPGVVGGNDPGGERHPEPSGDADEEPADDVDAGPARRRSSVRQGGRATVPAGRRSVVTEIPARARGMAIAAQLDGASHGLYVQSVSLVEDGTARITLNQRTEVPVDVVWFTVSGPAGPS
jgi:hypothetical protein